MSTSGGASHQHVTTVADACRAYALTKLEADKRFKRTVYGDLIANVKLDKLRRRHLDAWRARLESQPALVSRSNLAPTRTRTRAPSTVNRDMAPFRAALNKVLAPGVRGTEAAWREALKPIRNADGRRDLCLDRVQRQQLVNYVDSEALPFVKSLCLLPLRPGAMADLRVSDFDPKTAELRVGKDKTGKPRRFHVPSDAAALLSSQSKNRDAVAPLFIRANGRAWDKESWKGPISSAARDAVLPDGTTAYTLRHSTITDLVLAGLPLLSIAQISGTSVEMIERHYGHLVNDAAVGALATLAFQ